MHTQDSDLKNILAIFSLSNPELIEALTHKAADSELVAAKLISSVHKDDVCVGIKAVDHQQYQFDLDLSSRVYQSKGNWIWVNQIDIYFCQKKLLNVIIKPRVIDLPYTNNRLCAHWLFKNIADELKSLINNYL